MLFIPDEAAKLGFGSSSCQWDEQSEDASTPWQSLKDVQEFYLLNWANWQQKRDVLSSDVVFDNFVGEYVVIVIPYTEWKQEI